MPLAELFVRLGLTMVAFMVMIAHLLWLAVLPRVECSAITPEATEGPELWMALYALAPITLTLTMLLLVSSKLPAVVPILRWGCVPVALLLPFALCGTLPTFSATTLGGAPMCPGDSGYSSLVWQQAWGPVQLFLILLIALQSARYWLMAAQQLTRARIEANLRAEKLADL